MLIVGVNGGGTKTEALCCDGNGRITGRGRSGSSNYNNVGIDSAIKSIKSAVDQAAGRSPDLMCVALAGLNTKKDFDKMGRALSRHYSNLILEHDAFAELYGAANGKPGIIVIAGTGSIVLGYDGKNRYRRCDSGYFLGDEGSGYYIGKEGLKATARMLIEDMERIRMASEIMDHLKLKSGDDLMGWVYSERNTVSAVAAIGGVVCDSADDGDPSARAIVKASSSTVARAACELAEKLRIKTVYIKGGIARSRIYYSNFSSTLSKNGIRCRHLKDSHAEGALLIAADKAGIKVSLP